MHDLSVDLAFCTEHAACLHGSTQDLHLLLLERARGQLGDTKAWPEVLGLNIAQSKHCGVWLACMAALKTRVDLFAGLTK
eukprot:1144225-Pelagomonas_calceolata.AAC.2